MRVIKTYALEGEPVAQDADAKLLYAAMIHNRAFVAFEEPSDLPERDVIYYFKRIQLGVPFREDGYIFLDKLIDSSGRLINIYYKKD